MNVKCFMQKAIPIASEFFAMDLKIYGLQIFEFC